MAISISAHQPAALEFARAGLLAIKAGDYRAGAVLLNRAVRLDPTLSEAWRWLGALHSGARRAICLEWARRTNPYATIPPLPTPTPLPPRAAARPAPRKRRAVRHLRLASGGVMLATALAVGGFQIAYADRVYPGVEALGVPLSGLSPEAARQALAPRLAAWGEQKVILTADSRSWSVRFKELAGFSPEAVANSAFSLGRDGDLADRVLAQGGGLIGHQSVPAPALDAAAVEQLLDILDTQTAREAETAAFIQNPDRSWSVKPETAGARIDRDAARQRLLASWATVDWSGDPAALRLDLPRQVVQPERTAAELTPLLPALNAQTAAPLLVQNAGKQWELDRSILLDLSALPKAGQPFGVNRAALDTALANIAQEHNQEAVASQLVRQGNRATQWRLGQAGRSLDTAAAARLIQDALARGAAEPIELPFIASAPPPGELEALGITGVVGSGKSQFASYSAPNRDANVIAGGNEFDGLLVAPGELLSFNTTVGEITAAKGYQMGEMIAGGVIVPSYGGGICQVSTTLFRAALWAGLPIEERHNHSWRLAWYEVDAPPGLDATIALGGPDLQIRNTTDGWLLIDVETDTVNKTQTFTLYGTPRDIEVSLDGPTWDNAGGLVITRRITQHGSVIGEDSWTSYYSQ